MRKLNLNKSFNKVNAKIYIDYDNVLERISSYGESVENLYFLENLVSFFEGQGLRIIDTLVYVNFDKPDLKEINHQTQILGKGFSPKHCSNNGKNSGDIEMTIDITNDLLTDKGVDVYIIVSNDRDFTPVMKNIKKNNKFIIACCSKNQSNSLLSVCSDKLLYFEEVFDLDVTNYQLNSIKRAEKIDIYKITEQDKLKARNIAKIYLDSKFYKNYVEQNRAVHLEGYSQKVSNFTKSTYAENVRLFEVAHKLGYLELFMDTDKNKVAIKAKK